MHIHFFSDLNANSFFPLTLTRPIEELRLGILTIRDKWLTALDTGSYSRESVFVPGDGTKDAHSAATTPVYWINSRYLPDANLLLQIEELNVDQALLDGDVPVVIVSSDPKFTGNSAEIMESIENKFDVKGSTSKLDYVWDLLSLNATETQQDIERIRAKTINVENFKDVIFRKPENIYASESAQIEAGAVLLAEEGPVYVGDNARIEAGAILRGPVVIHEHASVKMGARLYGGTTIGPHCKVGGEVSNTIFHSYSNKAHDGFIGNSLIGQWCNLGADTNTSNLKNNYSPVKISDWNTGESRDTGLQFLGTIMADHSKTAINTMLNTGTLCGLSSNIFMSSFPPKIIPSFSWMGDQGTTTYQWDKAIEAMKAMMARRNITPSEGYLASLRKIFEETAN